jgi:hypothetical protein
MEINQTGEDNTISDWLVWPGTIRFVSAAAVLSSAMLLSLFTVNLFPRLPWNDLHHWLALKILFGIVGVAGAISLQFLLVAMIWYWIKLDHSPPSRKTWWLLSFFCGFIGIPIYVWLVYRKQIRVATLAQE